MNIYDISDKAGVSIATVSRVLNHSPNVSPKTRDKVLSVMEQCGYTPNAFARGLGLNSMRTVGILCADSSDPYLAHAIYYLEQNLRNNGYSCLLCCTGYDRKTKQEYLELLLTKRIDGIILAGSNFVEPKASQNDYIRAAAQKAPVMILNGTLEGENIYNILCDDYTAVFEATGALLDNGVRDILFLYSTHTFSSLKKLSGFRSAYDSRMLPLDERLLCCCSGGLHSIRNILLQLREDGLDFGAVVAADDNLAAAALKYAKAAHLKVPSDLSVIGYNNSILAECCDPELTSVDNKLETLCIHCVRELMDLFLGIPVPSRTLFAAELVKRGSTAF